MKPKNLVHFKDLSKEGRESARHYFETRTHGNIPITQYFFRVTSNGVIDHRYKWPAVHQDEVYIHHEIITFRLPEYKVKLLMGILDNHDDNMREDFEVSDSDYTEFDSLLDDLREQYQSAQ